MGNDAQQVSERLLELSRELGEPSRKLAILGEGNTSARLEGGRFVVKASGQSLGTLSEKGLTVCDSRSVLKLLDLPEGDSVDVDAALLESRVDSSALKPSVEALFHAYLLSLPDINFVGHTHPVSVNQILCSRFAESFAEKRLFPDQIVCCGPASALVPYVDPGLALARSIREIVEAYIDRYGAPPVAILMRNHGLITLGKTPNSVLAATLMMEKSAEIFVGASQLNGGPPEFMSIKNVQIIAKRPDESYRRKMLNL